MDHNLSEFKPVSYTEWLNQIEKDLKGKPLSALESHPEPDLHVKAYHHIDDFKLNPIITGANKENNEWKIRRFFKADEASNTLILKNLNEGIEAIGLEIDATTPFTEWTKGVLFEHITTDLRFNDVETASKFNAPKNAVLNFDVIARNAVLGSSTLSLTNFGRFYQTQTTNAAIWVEGAIYGAAGASSVQELAFTLNHLNEYVHYLVDQGESLQKINSKIVIELAVNENYFSNIAKFRVIQSLVAALFKGYDAQYSYSPVRIYAKTNLRHLAQNDHNNNPLRETTQAMSAVIGGCDVLTVAYDQVGSPQDQERSKRIAKNIQLILKEEAYLNQVVDPSRGAYYIETLSNQILEKAWNLFLEVEKQSGLISEIMTNGIQRRIEENKTSLINDLQSNKRTFLGVNKHPNSTETWINTAEQPEAKKIIMFQPLTPFYLENYFTKSAKTNG